MVPLLWHLTEIEATNVTHTKKIVKKGNNNMERLAYTALVRLIFQYGVMCWDPYRESQVSALNRVQKRVAKLANNKNESRWETLAQRRLIAQICAPFKAYIGRWTWKAIGDRILQPCYLSRDVHNQKIRTRKQQILVNIPS